VFSPGRGLLDADRLPRLPGRVLDGRLAFRFHPAPGQPFPPGWRSRSSTSCWTASTPGS